jgi:hypothetical protein
MMLTQKRTDVFQSRIYATSRLVGRIMVSCLVVSLFCLSLHITQVWSLFTGRTHHSLVTQPAIGSQKVIERTKDVFWPRFPAHTAPKLQDMVINGVELIAENWETTASSPEVLGYYRQQMLARGWGDVTEETLNLQSGIRDQGEGENRLQDPRFLELYRGLMDSTLVMNRGSWTLRVTTEPGKNHLAQTKVTISAASTPSLLGYSEALKSALSGGRNAGRTDKAVDVVEHIGKEHYHTTIVARSETPAQAFQEALVNLGTRGWRPVMFLPKQERGSGFFAWLVTGKQYAALSVSLSAQGSSVTMTEVTPE